MKCEAGKIPEYLGASTVELDLANQGFIALTRLFKKHPNARRVVLIVTTAILIALALSAAIVAYYPVQFAGQRVEFNKAMIGVIALGFPTLLVFLSCILSFQETLPIDEYRRLGIDLGMGYCQRRYIWSHSWVWDKISHGR